MVFYYLLSILVPLKDFCLPFGAEGDKAGGEAADFYDKALVAVGVLLRVKEVFATEAVWLK